MKRLLVFVTLFIISVSKLSLGQTIVYPGDRSLQEIGAKEVRRYIYLRTGQKIPIEQVNSLPENGDVILIAKDDNKIMESLIGSLAQNIPADGFIIKTI